ncbi:hypothetical protein EJB05_08957, partial [Eragrostis curvula]
MACCFPWCTSEEAVRRKHVYEIRDYGRVVTSVGANECVSSAPFSVGGYDWAVRFYPHGVQNAEPGYASAFVKLLTPGATARASFKLTLLPWSSSGSRRGQAIKLCPRKFGGVGGYTAWGRWSFVKTTKLESPAFLLDDTVRIECDITVFVKRKPAAVTAVPSAPPSELPADLGKLMTTDSGGAPAPDVLILVGGESFAAHSLVLWMRCRELYDMATAASSSCVTIAESDVQPAVFRDLLRYIYTEALPDMDGLGTAQTIEKLRALLTAAVRYKMDRLKLVCESALCASLDARTVVATLAVAEQLHLTTLRSACIKFIASSASQIE